VLRRSTSATGERRERVLVGDVVADVQGDDVAAVETQRREQMHDRLALVPVEIRLELVDHLAGRHLQVAGVPGQQLVDDRLDPRPVRLVDEPVVHRHRARFGLHERARHRAGAVAQVGGDRLQQPFEAFRHVELDLAAAGAPDVEAVAAGHDQVVQSHQPLDDRPVAAADHAHAGALRQPLHRVAHALGDHRVLRPVDDRRQRPVVVEEDGHLLAGQSRRQRPEVLERVRQLADACARHHAVLEQ
jgi:hypothetical protein